MADKTYVGVGWEKKFNDGGSAISISVKLVDVNKLAVDKYGNVRLVVATRRTPDEKSKATHSVAVDDYWYSKNPTQ
jgi:hypothetical protein